MVLLLDAWQLQPLLLRTDTSQQHSDHSIAEHLPDAVPNGRRRNMTDSPRSIMIVDNSHFYPVFMTYDIGTGTHSVPNQSQLHQHTGYDACECIRQSASEKDFSELLQARVEQLAKQYQMTHQWNSDGQRPLSAVIMHDDANAGKASKTSAKSSFLRFMQRVRARTKPKLEKSQATPPSGKRSSEIPQPFKSNDVHANAPEQNNNCNRSLTDTVIKGSEGNYNSAEWHMMLRRKEQLIEHNLKLKWLMCTKPKLAAFKMRLVQRRHSIHGTGYRAPIVAAVHKAHDKQASIMIKPNDYDIVFCERFRTLGWSCSDLLDVQQADRLRKFHVKQEKYHRRMRARWQSDRFETQSARNISDSDNSSLMSGEVVVRKHPKRRASFRLKRHSIDSATAMTDVVKAWVYRKRFSFFSTTLLTKLL